MLLKDDSGLLVPVVLAGGARLAGGGAAANVCARCGLAVEHSRSVHVHRSGESEGWQLCPEHAVGFLNQLRTVEPKLSVETLSLAGDWQ